MNVKVAILMASGFGFVWWLATRKGAVLLEGAIRDSYYGGGGRCFRQSDDVEVSLARCAERGVSTGSAPSFAPDDDVPGQGLIDGARALYGSLLGGGAG